MLKMRIPLSALRDMENTPNLCEKIDFIIYDIYLFFIYYILASQ